MVKRDKSNYIIQSVAHALDVLEEFKGDAVELGVTELHQVELWSGILFATQAVTMAIFAPIYLFWADARVLLLAQVLAAALGAVARTDVALHCFDRNALHDLFQDHPRLHRTILENLNRVIATPHQQPVLPTSTVNPPLKRMASAALMPCASTGKMAWHAKP